MKSARHPLKRTNKTCHSRASTPEVHLPHTARVCKQKTRWLHPRAKDLTFFLFNKESPSLFKCQLLSWKRKHQKENALRCAIPGLLWNPRCRSQSFSGKGISWPVSPSIFFFPPIEGDCNQILSKALFPFFWKEECKESEAWVSFFFLFQGRRVQSPYLFQDRAKYLMSTCPSFSDRCFSKGNSPVLWFCHVSQGKGIFCLGTQNLMGRLHASINVWNSQ